MRAKTQVIRDESREIYSITFPTELDTDRVMAWLRSVSGTLPKRAGRVLAKDTMAFETWASSTGITHRLMVPKSAAEYIAAQLRTHGRGISVVKDDSRPTVEWTDAINVGMSSPLRTLRISKHSDLAASLLGSIQALQGDEQVMIQWVVHPARYECPPSSDRFTATADFKPVRSILGGQSQASNDEVTDRRKKLEEPNLLGIGRIAARAENDARARELIYRVESALAGANSQANYFKGKNGKAVASEANDAASVMLFPNQFTLSELAAVIAWPIGQPFVAGLPQGTTRHVYATDDISTVGRILGDSNYPGHERPVALTYDYAVQHSLYAGKTGTGKTVLMANSFAQDVAAGYGSIVIDASNSESNETMFQRALRVIPRDRIEDVVILNVQADRMNPVGFNVLEQGNPRVVADQITELFAHLYSDTSGVWVKRLLMFGIYTLAERPGLTLADLVPLLSRKTPSDAAWADDLIESVKDRDIRDFWTEWEHFSPTDRDRYTQPLVNRIWQLVSRPEVRDIIGQSHSSFQISDLLRDNKILLVNLAGLPPETSSILGTLLVNAIWTAAQTMKPDKPNFLYLDEFQVMTAKLPFGLDDMLNRSRKHNLGVVMATQYLENVDQQVRNAAINSARTKVIFQTSAKEARVWQGDFGRTLDENDFMRIRQYEAVAQIATSSGITTPVTISTRPPMPSTGTIHAVRQHSAKTYGRPIADVEAERYTRRSAAQESKGPRPKIGVEAWTRDD